METKSEVNPGVGYRLLAIGEIRQDGDEYLSSADGYWHLSELIGREIRNGSLPNRRRNAPAKIEQLSPPFVSALPGAPDDSAPGIYYYEYDGKRYRWDGKAWWLYGIPGY